MDFYYFLAEIFIPILLLCIGGVAIIVFGFQKDVKFLRPWLLVAFGSFALLTFCAFTGFYFPAVLRFLHIRLEGYDGMGVLLLLILLFMAGGLCCLVTSVYCLGRLIEAILFHVRKSQTGKGKK